MQIKVDDIVEVIAGDDREVRGRVLTVNPQTGKLVVEGVNLVYKHVRRSQRNPQGGRLSKEMPVQVSNVLLVCQKCNQATRLGVTRGRQQGALLQEVEVDWVDVTPQGSLRSEVTRRQIRLDS